MMKNKFKVNSIFYSFSCLISLLTIGHVFAIECPNGINAPLCPDTGSTLLDETYPTQAFVISNAPQQRGIQSSKVTSEYISAIAKSYDYENMPQVFVPVPDQAGMKKIIDDIKANLVKNKVSENKIEKIISQVTHVPSEQYTWQQDYFESFVDLKTGKPVLREFSSYLRSRPMTLGAIAKIEQAGKQCEIAQGEILESYHPGSPSPKVKIEPGDASSGSGEMGGNVEGAPGGFCLTGNNQSKKLATSYCGKEENVIQLQTNWLQVGHVDEIFKIIPSHFNDNRPKECQFSLMAASPKKAFELMESGQGRRLPFNSFSTNLSQDELNEIKRSRAAESYGSYGGKIICDYIQKAMSEGSYSPDQMENEQKTNGARSVFLNLIIDQAVAGATTLGRSNPTDGRAKFKCEDHIDKIPNENIHQQIMKDEDLLKLNNQIQVSIDKDKELIKSKILSRLPQCAKYYDEIDAPNIFYGSSVIEKNGKLELPNPGDINSFLPNPTNSVLMNRTILLPESGNPSFDNYVEQELLKRKIKMDKIDTWDYAHVGNGNIHCSSHSIPYCKPRN